jgi:hypothetical protein
LPPKKWGPGIPDLKTQKFFDFGELGKIEANGYEEQINATNAQRVNGENKTILPDIVQESDKIAKPRIIQTALRGICFAIALCAAIVSGNNSFEYFRTLRPTTIAFLMAITMVGSASLLPDLGIYLWQYKHRFVSFFVTICGIIAISFCMVTTLAALYNTRTARTGVGYANSKQMEQSMAMVNDARNEKVRIQNELLQVDGLISSTQAKIDSIGVDQTLSDTSQVLQGRLNRYLKDKKGYEDRLVVLQSILDRPVDSSKVSRSDFYSFIATIFHQNSPDKVEFLTGAIPSVFLEIVTPIMLGVALFL